MSKTATALTIGAPVGNGKTWGDTSPGDVYRHPDGATFRVLRHRTTRVVVENTCGTDDDGQPVADSTETVPKGFPLNPVLVYVEGRTPAQEVADRLSPTMREQIRDHIRRGIGFSTATRKALDARGLTEDSEEFPFVRLTPLGAAVARLVAS